MRAIDAFYLAADIRLPVGREGGEFYRWLARLDGYVRRAPHVKLHPLHVRVFYRNRRIPGKLALFQKACEFIPEDKRDLRAPVVEKHPADPSRPRAAPEFLYRVSSGNLCREREILHSLGNF
ncbi:MAG: hypothetical protein NT157_02970, partial [Candidatus Micrarchaeota archaeon]|nr:hypothetical protein [Candidatus Micrarchaeota archaeon]